MKRTIICCLIVFLLFTASNKENDIELLQNDNEIEDKKPDITIEDICYYIFTDLNIKWNYSNLENLFRDLKFTDNYIIRESVVKNTIHSGEGYIHFSDIEYGQYKIIVSAFSNYSDYIDDPKIYMLDSIEIEITDKNYLDLFPYNSMEDYINDNNFGGISEINMGENNIYYYMRYEQMIKYGNDRFGYSDLLFSDGLLKSIVIIRYIP